MENDLLSYHSDIFSVREKARQLHREGYRRVEEQPDQTLEPGEYVIRKKSVTNHWQSDVWLEASIHWLPY